MIKFRPIIRSREGRRVVARELRYARKWYRESRRYVGLRQLLLDAKSNCHYDKLHLTVRANNAPIMMRPHYQCQARWADMAEDALAIAYASLTPGSIPLPSGFTFILMETDMSWRPEFLVQGEWGSNAQRFETMQEALDSAQARFMSWTMPSDYRASESLDPVNYRRVDGCDEFIGNPEPPKAA